MVVDKQRRKDIIDCINKKFTYKFSKDEITGKSKNQLIKESKRYFKGLKGRTEGGIIYGFTIEDTFVTPSKESETSKNTLSIYPDYFFIFYMDIIISKSNSGNIEFWDIEEIKKFYDNRENILMKIAEKYGCENTLLINKMLYRFW
jgi:hypothetical protein